MKERDARRRTEVSVATESTGPDVSVVVPVYNNADTLEELYRRLSAVMAVRGVSFELILVDDGSTDSSWEVIRKLRVEEPRVRAVRLARNFGQHAAFCAGLERMRGRMGVALDADLENRPEDVPALLDELERGTEFVSGRRVRRRSPFLARRLPSWILNRLAQSLTGVRISDYGCALNAFTPRLAREVLHQGERRRFLKPLFAMLARSVREVPVAYAPRPSGRSSYGFESLVGLQLDFFTSFSRKPFQVFGILGVLLFLAGVGGGGIYLVFFAFGVSLGVRVQALLILAAVLGIQLAVMGLLGEFTVRTYHVAQNEPFYDVAEDSGGSE
jgi:glycosyltransferase involved in cell wall biosynthesis